MRMESKTRVDAPAVAGQHWYVVRAKTKQENRAELNLRGWGVEAFTPRVREASRRPRGETTFVSAPLFPGYLFARFDAAHLLTKVRLTRGVHSIVGFGEPATPIQDAAIALIRNRVRDDGLVHLDEPSAGDVVEVVQGPLRTLVGIFDSALSGGERARILLMSVPYRAHVELPRAFLRKTGAM
jgi:transcriptional antiterminator RfaH